MIKPIHKRTIPQLLTQCRNSFNRWIRERDKHKGFISCGGPVQEAGHFFSAGHHSALRFNEMNVNGQCTRCNHFLSGNLIHYRNGLIKRYGEQKVLVLESSARHPAKTWTRGELEILIRFYKAENSATTII